MDETLRGALLVSYQVTSLAIGLGTLCAAIRVGFIALACDRPLLVRSYLYIRTRSDRRPIVHYLFLFIAIAAELVATALMKSTHGFTRLWPTLAVLVGYTASFVLLAHAVKTIEVGVAYAIWSGVGTAAIVAIGAVFLGEPLTTVKVAGIALIIGGVVMLNLNTSGAH